MQALVVINAKAGSLSPETIERSLREALAHHPAKWRDAVSFLVTDDPAEVRNIIDQRHAELDRVIAAGGDGTVTEVISAIMPYPHLKLGILPVGTANRLAVNLGIPTHIKGALDTALKGVPYALDVGRINQRYFSLMAGAGLDAEIMDRVQPLEKRTMGVLAYVWQGVRRAFQTPYAIFEIEADGKMLRCRGIGVVVANAGNLLGRYFTLTPGAQVDDGLFDICVLASRNRTDYWTTLIQILSQEHRGIAPSGVKHLRARHIRIRSRPKVKAQADGDVIGETPIEIEALPQAITVLVPPIKKTPNPLSDIGNSIQHIGDHLRLVLRDLMGR